MNRTTVQAVGLAVVCMVAVAGGVYIWNAGSDAQQTAETRKTGKALIGGPFKLTDHTGNIRTEKDLLGRYTLMSFGFTQCPDVCPTTLQTMSEAMEALGPVAARIQPVFVSVDPDRDTVARLKVYHGSFDKRIMMLTGDTVSIARIAKAYKVGYKKMKPAADGSYQVNHSALIYLMGPKGEYITHYPYTITPAKLAEGLKKWAGRGS